MEKNLDGQPDGLIATETSLSTPTSPQLSYQETIEGMNSFRMDRQQKDNHRNESTQDDDSKARINEALSVIILFICLATTTAFFIDRCCSVLNDSFSIITRFYSESESSYGRITISRRLLEGESKIKVTTTIPSSHANKHGGDNLAQDASSSKKSTPKILYIITSLAEYNTGNRGTRRGSDRFQETLIPVVSETVHSILSLGYDVDVFLICHYPLVRYEMIRKVLPENVGFNYWDDATPIGYSMEHSTDVMRNITRGLARQHRFVIKDLFFGYDFFCVFEDDMIIKGEHIQQYLHVSNEVSKLRASSPKSSVSSRRELQHLYHGDMIQPQLKRMIPGFIRVETLLEGSSAQKSTGPVPVDMNFQEYETAAVDPVCCHVRKQSSSKRRPMSPNSSTLFLWETNILALGVREMPNTSDLGWVMMQRGPGAKQCEDNEVIGDYWVNSKVDVKVRGRDNFRPRPTNPNLVNNQGGWMATRQQIWEWHTELCLGGFLPPFDAPHFNFDGLDMRNVEYWSGGLQLFTARHGCNLQRIIPLHPTKLSRHLLYHSANNKQQQLSFKMEERFVKVETLIGQLNHVKKQAEADKLKELANGDRSKMD